MNCPFCEKEMVSGAVQCGGRMYFTEKPRFFGRIPREGDVGIATSVDAVTAWHCPDCRRVIMDYTDIWQEVYGQQ